MRRLSVFVEVWSLGVPVNRHVTQENPRTASLKSYQHGYDASRLTELAMMKQLKLTRSSSSAQERKKDGIERLLGRR